MAKVLNIDGTNYNQFFSQILDNVEYILHIYYNSRNQGWYISFYDPDTYEEGSTDNTDALIYGGRRLMPNQEVLSRYKPTTLPQGVLVCYDNELKDTSEQESVTDGTFGVGNRYNLLYFTESDVEGF